MEIETTPDKADQLVEHIKVNHGIDVPEVVVNDLDTDIVADGVALA